MRKSVVIFADLKNWAVLYDSISQYFSKLNIPKKDVLGMLISAEEIFSNIVHHSKSERNSSVNVDMDYIQASRIMVLNFKYDGIEFNPSEVSLPDLNISLDKRNPGGWGLLIVKRFTDSITYKRSHGKNILELAKKAVNF